MIDNSYYSQEVHGPYELFDLGDLILEDGGTIRGRLIPLSQVGQYVV
jgi:homoserine O-acetyltransferase/O-succinyltransferase